MSLNKKPIIKRPYVGASDKAKSAAVRGNMRTVQIASEAYSTDCGGSYDAGTAYQNYLPGGSNSTTGSPGFIPLNPVTGQTGSIGASGLTTAAQISSQRTKAATTGAPITAGNIGYSQADAGQSYSVVGSDKQGNYIGGVGGMCLVLSNR